MKFSPLRDQILTLALTGQLVEQRAAEPEVQQIGPAPAPDEVPFAIPAKWKWVRLDDLADSIKYGYTASATDIGNAKFLRITDLKDGKVDWALVPFCEIDHKNLANMKLEPNDILIARSGAGSVGKSYVVENLEQGVDAVFASYLLRVRLKHDAPVWAMYVKHYLRSPIYWAAISQHARGSTGLINVNVKQLASLLLPLPPLEEQWRIVAVLDDLMARLDQMEQAYSELTGPMSDHLRNLVLQQAISGQLMPQLDSEPEVEQIGPAPTPDEEPFAIPAKWKWVRLEQVCTYIQRGKSPKYSEIKQLLVVAQKCNRWDGLHMELALFIAPETIASYQAERFLQQNDVLLNSTGTGTLGRVGMYDEALNPYGQAVADGHVTVIRADQSLILPSLIKYALSSATFQAIIIDAGTGTTKQQELALAKVKQLLIPLPPLEEQRRIVTKLDELFAGVKQLSSLKEFGLE